MRQDKAGGTARSAQRLGVRREGVSATPPSGRFCGPKRGVVRERLLRAKALSR